jgi:hypothetical protein
VGKEEVVGSSEVNQGFNFDLKCILNIQVKNVQQVVGYVRGPGCYL